MIQVTSHFPLNNTQSLGSIPSISVLTIFRDKLHSSITNRAIYFLVQSKSDHQVIRFRVVHGTTLRACPARRFVAQL